MCNTVYNQGSTAVLCENFPAYSTVDLRLVAVAIAVSGAGWVRTQNPFVT